MNSITRRAVLGGSAMIGGWLAAGAEAALAQAAGGGVAADGPYTLPPLPYDYADLEPHIDVATMKLHHDVHHAAYVRGANAALAELGEVRRAGGDTIQKVRALTDALSFNLSGHLLHVVFWKNMKKDGGGDPPAGSPIAGLIQRDFGSMDAFRGHFQAAAQQVQGSGWGILGYEPLAQRLLVLQAEKHQNCGVWGVVPLLVLDVWEHAYYLHYQNKRSDYIKAFMNVVDWGDVNERLTTATKLNG